jgi:hypothetical protein
MSNDEALSREQVDARVRRARDLIAHPERMDAAGKDEIEDLLRALVALADTFLGRPVTIPEWARNDPYLHDRMLVELCRLYDEKGQLDLTPELLPMLVRRFPELVTHLEARSKGKSGAHRIERMMHLWIEGFGNSVDEAAKVVARAANVSPESAKVQYYNWRRNNSDKKAP